MRLDENVYSSTSRKHENAENTETAKQMRAKGSSCWERIFKRVNNDFGERDAEERGGWEKDKEQEKLLERVKGGEQMQKDNRESDEKPRMLRKERKREWEIMVEVSYRERKRNKKILWLCEKEEKLHRRLLKIKNNCKEIKGEWGERYRRLERISQ